MLNELSIKAKFNSFLLKNCLTKKEGLPFDNPSFFMKINSHLQSRGV